MLVIDNFAEWRQLRRGIGESLGLVPTMGFLHEGHLSLVRRARRENSRVVVWIFVNPRQFGPAEDFESYPRNRERDLSLLEKEGVDYVLAPSVEEVYPPGHCTRVVVDGLSEVLEGRSRPGHFAGVATVVAKMLSLTRSDRAYFGQKDGQQCRVIQSLTADLGLDTAIVVCPTVREHDGLAMSSRNVYLTQEERAVAPLLFLALSEAGRAAGAGEQSVERLKGIMHEVLGRSSLLRVEYVSIADETTLEELEILRGPAMASLAVRLGKARLIDNMTLLPASPD
ncbi:MAG: pantoate--beta-alanine ligase [Deltaproteobacteria bacterium]|nr:pantoate--beta-alanine ligase [Deltaproteobacteria bacterium]